MYKAGDPIKAGAPLSLDEPKAPYSDYVRWLRNLPDDVLQELSSPDWYRAAQIKHETHRREVLREGRLVYGATSQACGGGATTDSESD